jgi:site-specific recombinase XerD
VLSAEEIDSFVEHLDATQYRDTAIAWLLKDGGLRINEALQLRLSEVSWGQRILTIRAAKNKHERRVPISQDALAALSNYVRLERPKMLFARRCVRESWVARVRSAFPLPIMGLHL